MCTVLNLERAWHILKSEVQSWKGRMEWHQKGKQDHTGHTSQAGSYRGLKVHTLNSKRIILPDRWILDCTGVK